MKPTQIIVNGLKLPFTSRDKYSCPEEILREQITMISGRMVEEVRGKIWRPSYSYDYLGNEFCRMLLAELRSGRALPCSVLPDGGTALVTSTFLVESLTPPTVAFSRGDEIYWHNIAFTLREVRPHA